MENFQRFLNEEINIEPILQFMDKFADADVDDHPRLRDEWGKLLDSYGDKEQEAVALAKKEMARRDKEKLDLRKAMKGKNPFEMMFMQLQQCQQKLKKATGGE